MSATQAQIDNSNTAAIASANASLQNLMIGLNNESNRAQTAENNIFSAISKLSDKGRLIDPSNSIETTTALEPLSGQTDDNVGRVYLLVSEQEGYTKNRMYRLLKTGGEYSYSDVKTGGIPIGAVKNIRFSFVEGTLLLSWEDPKNTLSSIWAGTRIMYKAYDTVQDNDATAYPNGPFDGTLLYNETLKNQYNVEHLSIDSLDPDKVYYIRFFPYTKDNVYTVETLSPFDNRFYTESYGWGTLLEHLENFQSESSFLPLTGGEISVDYLIDDFYTDTSTNKFRLALTRDAVLQSFSNPNASWNITETKWRILGYNTSIPQYVKYRSFDSVLNAYDYKYISSVNDAVSSVEFKDLNGDTMTRKVLMGDLYLKPSITVGDQIYSRTYDGIEGEQLYTLEDYTLTAIDAASGTFTYGNYNTFSVPMKVTMNGKDYEFCGYTMTIQPQDLLTGAHPTNDDVATTTTINTYTTVQFDPPEAANAPAMNTYPEFDTASSDYGYYYENSLGQMVSIDVRGESLSGTYTQLYDGNPVVKLKAVPYAPRDAYGNPIPSFDVQTQYFQNGHRYAHEDGTVMTAGTDYTVGAVIPTTEGFLELNKDSNRVNYGCNIYAQSAYRQTINMKVGAKDTWYVPQNRFESGTPTYALANSNGIRLKLEKEPEMLNKIVPTVNRTQVATNNQYYIKNTGTYYYTVDYFFPLSRLEVNFSDGNTNEGAAKYSDVYTADNATRIKKYILRTGLLGSAAHWWIRSPVTGYTYLEYLVTSAGASSSFYASYYAYGCAPACTIG